MRFCQLRLDYFNSAVLALMDRLGVTNVRAQMRLFAAQPHLALHLLLSEG